MAGDERLREFSKLKAERDKGRWTDDEYRQLMAAIRDGVERYRQVRQEVIDNREVTTNAIPSSKPTSGQHRKLSLPTVSGRTAATIAAIVGAVAVLAVVIPVEISLVLLMLGIPTAIAAWILKRWMRLPFAVGGGFFIVIAAFAIIGSMMALPRPPSSIARPGGSPASAPEPVPQPKKKADWEIAAEEAQCRQDLQCWGDRKSFAAAVKCAPHIERLAKYSFEWTDGWLGSKMSQFRWKNRDRGVITYIGDKIKLQNGFGAWSPYNYACDFDTMSETVLGVRLAQGSLP
ncbi:MAG: hypothetical protein MZV65_28575 [Chromatiales bacterium]|nr:hypothetical protein [Chromatiales bacterium]